MAGSTILLLENILKEDYQGAVRDQLHREMRLLQLFEKGKASWSGKDFVVGLRVGKNSGIGFRGEGGAMPPAGNQGFLKILNRAKFLYGTFEVGGPDIAASSNGGSMALANSLHDEMKFLVEDVKDFADKMLFTGGQVKGLINEAKVGTAAAGGAVAGGTSAGDVGQDSWQYSGEFDCFKDSTGAGPAFIDPNSWVRVDVVKMDTYTSVVDNVNDEVYVTAIDEANCTVELTTYTKAAGATGGKVDTSSVGDGIACAIVLSAAAGEQGVYLHGGASDKNRDSSLQYSGILDNLCNPSHHSIARDDTSVAAAAAGTGAAGAGELKSTILTMAVAATHATQARVAISAARMQKALDLVRNESKRRPDIWLTNPLTRHKYIAASTLTQNVNAGSASGVDFGSVEQKLGFAGIPVEVDSNCPKSLMIGLNTGSWKLYELKPGDFDDTDGKILRKLDNQDRFKGVWKWYCQLVCEYPNQNVIICGYDL